MWIRKAKCSFERLLNIGKKEIKIISNKLLNKEGTYDKWMRYYFTPKTFYNCKNLIAEIKRSNVRNITKLKLTNLLDYLFKNKFFSDNDIEYIIKERGYYFILLLIGNFRKGKLELEKKYYSFFKKIIFAKKIDEEKIFLGSKRYIFNCLDDLNFHETINLVFPVCPDYEYKSSKGKNIYTFDSVGSGIGLVASKSLSVLSKLESIAKELSIDIQNSILIGDFEATNENCERLGIDRKEFLFRMKESCKEFDKVSSENTISGFFTEETIGKFGWESLFNKFKAEKFDQIENFEQLYLILPDIKHERIFNMRMRMYKRWFPDKSNLFRIFINQINEYVLMGKIINLTYKNPILITSDHVSMAPYYSAFQGCKPLSTFIEYH